MAFFPDACSLFPHSFRKQQCGLESSGLLNSRHEEPIEKVLVTAAEASKVCLQLQFGGSNGGGEYCPRPCLVQSNQLDLPRLLRPDEFQSGQDVLYPVGRVRKIEREKVLVRAVAGAAAGPVWNASISSTVRFSRTNS